ncbi:MAG: hypothetical protein Q4P06_08090 [Actinomycetaceae bacterium]|nr:hypothetical protein [Actinomycetaceae bacterium]
MQIEQVSILVGVEKSYDWGSTDAIQNLTGSTNRGRIAELWFSSDPTSPSRQIAIANDGEQDTPSTSSQRIDLPFKAKFLAISGPLSIQVHPSDQFVQTSRESDPEAFNCGEGKYETLLALEPTALVAGIADPGQVQTIFPRAMVEAARYLELYDHSPVVAYESLCRAILNSTPGQVSEFLTRVDNSAAELEGNFASDLRRAATAFNHHRHVMLLGASKYFELNAGESIDIVPGVPHSYLRGFGVEVTSPSENIARLGLTRKSTDAEVFFACLQADKESGLNRQGMRPQCKTNDVCGVVPGISVTHRWTDRRTPLYRQMLKGEKLNRLLIPLSAKSRIEIGSKSLTAGTALLFAATIRAGESTPSLAPGEPRLLGHVEGHYLEVSWPPPASSME